MAAKGSVVVPILLRTTQASKFCGSCGPNWVGPVSRKAVGFHDIADGAVPSGGSPAIGLHRCRSLALKAAVTASDRAIKGSQSTAT